MARQAWVTMASKMRLKLSSPERCSRIPSTCGEASSQLQLDLQWQHGMGGVTWSASHEEHARSSDNQ